MRFKLQIHGSGEFEASSQAEECIKKLLEMKLASLNIVLKAIDPNMNSIEELFKPGQRVHINGNKFKGNAVIKSIDEQKVRVVFEPGMQDFRGEQPVTHNKEFKASYTRDEVIEMFSEIQN